MSALRIAVTGVTGQVATALRGRAGDGVEVVTLGRPTLDLCDRTSVHDNLRGAQADVIVNAGAYTAVDKAETEPALAMRVNADGAGFVAEVAAELGTPLLHLSTDYVFDGRSTRPYREDDPTCPLGAYGRSKLAGEERIAEIWQNHVILRTAWVYSPFGSNFVRTMLRLGETRSEVSVVADQFGNPTSALDIADTIIAVARRVSSDPLPSLRGVFHMTAPDQASWADFADAIFAEAERHGRLPVKVNRIGTFDYPTPAARPANSRLDTNKLATIFEIFVPSWRLSLRQCIDRLLVPNSNYQEA